MTRQLRRLALAVAAAAVGGALAASSSSSSSSSSASSSSSSSGSGSSGSSSVHTLPLVKLETRSGIQPWVDPDTPEDVQVYTSSRGDPWELVMSDEFNNPSRNFTPGGDHMWTSLEMADGTNAALQYYGHNMSTVVCDESDDDGTESVCYFQIEIIDALHTITVYNIYSRPPSYQNSTFYYRAGSIQSWNKFCFQGGMVEVRVQLPGGISKKSKNPDLKKASSARVTDTSYYPTWPGVWFMGNLGRALFSASTSRMWPFSYDECDERVFNSSNQRISACDPSPGSGMNPYQGRGAPEIDLLEGGGTAISSSIQIGPGMPEEYRRVEANVTDGDNLYCFYGKYCTTEGANDVGVPTDLYAERKYQSWYGGLRYAANNFCAIDGNDTQVYSEIKANIENITANACNVTICPASNDVYSDLDYIDGVRSRGHWGINSNGTCFPAMNAYQGAFLCDPDNQDERCSAPRNDTTAKTNTMEPFAYQMDAISSNWGIHVGAYTSFVRYQLEWVTGEDGYIRWMIEGHPIFEIPAEAIIGVGQDSSKSNPVKIFPEEPMYIIFNVALSSSWGTTPPNAGKPCRGDGEDDDVNLICDSFPMHMKIDYIRVYQDRSNGSTMAVGCDPSTHPTKKWIEDHIDEYTDADNTWVEVQGGAPCRDYKDCNFPYSVEYAFRTGQCNADSKCECTNPYWGGPRCTYQLKATSANGELAEYNYGPPMYAVFIVAGIALTITLVILVVFSFRRRAKRARQLQIQQKAQARKSLMDDLYIAKSAVMASGATPTPNAGFEDESEQSKSATYHSYD